MAKTTYQRVCFPFALAFAFLALVGPVNSFAQAPSNRDLMVKWARLAAQEVPNINEASLLARIAQAQARAGELVQAKATIEQAQKRAALLRDNELTLKVDAYMSIALAYALIQDKAGRDQAMNKAFISLKDVTVPAQRYVFVARVASAQAGFPAGDEWKQTIDLIQDPYLRANLFKEIALTLADAGRIEDYKVSVAACENEMTKLTNLQALPIINRGLAAAHVRAKDFAKAQATADSISKDANGPVWKTWTYLDLAEAQLDAGNLDAAKANAQSANQTLQDVKQGKAELLMDLARVQMQLGDKPGAERSIRSALDGASASQQPIEKATLYLRIAAAQTRTGNTAGAADSVNFGAAAAKGIFDLSEKGRPPKEAQALAQQKQQVAREYIGLAEAQAAIGLIAESQATAESIPIEGAKNRAMAGIAIELTRAGKHDDARKVMDLIIDSFAKVYVVNNVCAERARKGTLQNIDRWVGELTHPRERAEAGIAVVEALAKLAKTPSATTSNP
jgi:tetratricopeptide (TPR) repeat protein